MDDFKNMTVSYLTSHVILSPKIPCDDLRRKIRFYSKIAHRIGR